MTDAEPTTARLYPAKTTEIATGFVVRRALPNRERRLVGAWCFLDHAGPVDHAPGATPSVGPHPHIGLQTFTWMIAGEILHRDSLGTEQIIRPGQVNLMTAGRGIAHAEEAAPGQSTRTHLVQLWIALPDAHRHEPPAFQHCPELPRVRRDGFEITVLAGSALGQTAPPRVYSPLVGLDLLATTEAATRLPIDRAFEHAIVCLEHAIEVDGQRLEPGALLYLGLGRDAIDLRCSAGARAILIGGAPFGEAVAMSWNFVARTSEELARAAEDWNAHRHFAEVASPLARIPAPDLSGIKIRASKDA